MKKDSRRRPREHMDSASARPLHQTMDDTIYYPSSTHLTQKFSLNSYNRRVARKGLGHRPLSSIIPSEVLRMYSGRKVYNIDLDLLSQSFSDYRKAVNIILERVFSDLSYADMLCEEMEKSRGLMYLVLRKEKRLSWEIENELGQLVFERLHRNALETAARIIYTHYTRRRLVNSFVDILSSEPDQILRLMRNRRVPSDLIRRVKDTVEKKSNGTYHYALSACRQVRKLLQIEIRKATPLEEGESRRRVSEMLKADSHDRVQIEGLLNAKIVEWKVNGFPFASPTFQQATIDYTASTENSTGQGYWYEVDDESDDEVILYIKSPPGIVSHEQETSSPYKSQTIRLRFLNWFPRKAERARRKAQEARKQGQFQRSVQLEYRAARLDDMSNQLLNTIKLQKFTRELASQRAQQVKDETAIADLKSKIHDLKKSRRSAPPLIKIKGKKVTLHIPFQPPDEEILRRTLSSIPSQEKHAGVDRGLRHSMVVSVRNGDDIYEETMIGRQQLFEKRERLRQQTRVLMSDTVLKRNNWEKKHPEQQPPAHLLKKERELESVWRKIRRLDREISHQVAAETVWFCEHRGVKTIYFEDLRSFQGKGGMGRHSWNLSTNLWSKMIEGVRYRREALGHRKGGIWLVNPAWTSQTCHMCGERGVRVEDEVSTEERKGGEYFYCSKCKEHFHADVNAARNIMDVQSMKPTAVGGRTA